MENNPLVYKAVRAIGTLRPKFQPSQGKAFIEGLDVIATAFWLKDYKVLITCAHVVENLLGAPIELIGLLVVGNMGKYSRAVVSCIDLDHDLSILRLAEVPQDFIDKESQDGLVLVNANPGVGEPVGYAGFPLGQQLLNSTHAPTYAEGVIGAALRHAGVRKNIQITGAVAGGFSGSPVVLKGTDKLIGVLSNSPSKEAGQANIFLASSWEHVKAIAELSRS
ncbi:MAG: serine protease [Candidatus Omnitrophota bacterium]